ncbi:hypothetical protein [Halioxenophilus sp. WMMB6]|uniref:hypothetical protein n=1 Tax=Halioxenophilus sp. WMMB6 TaxID=3073815 RepID=UPI00295F579C|nr:hypothetical protein [Halioxenophilus sp. WMMB6]
MTSRIRRPELNLTNAQGLLTNDHFQIAYATNDIERALAQFKELGIHQIRRLEGKMAAGGYIRVELAWMGNTLYELITAEGPGSDLYMKALPDADFAFRLHHLGFLIYTKAQWLTLQTTVAKQGWPLLSENIDHGFMRHCFVDIPPLGHYLEFIWPEAAGLAYFAKVPAN